MARLGVKSKNSTYSFFSIIISISLVLLLLGIMGWILINSKIMSDYVKENISVSVFLKSTAKEADVIRFKKTLDASEFVKKTEYVDSEKAAQILKEDLGEDFISFLGYNPLRSSIDIYLNANYANTDSVTWIVKKVSSNELVKDVYYQKDLLVLVNDNVERISILLTSISALLFIIAIVLINNNIRLSVFSKRLLIRTMQLVGATPWFIARPFVMTAIIQGFLGGLVSVFGVFILVFYVQDHFPDIFFKWDPMFFVVFSVVLIFLGILTTVITSYIAVRKYIYINPDKLF